MLFSIYNMPYDTTVKSATKKTRVKLLVSVRFGQRQNNRAERSAEGCSFSSLSFMTGNGFLWLADQELALHLHGARTPSSPGGPKCSFRKLFTEIRKLEKTVNKTVMLPAFVYPVGMLHSSFHISPFFSFTLSSTSSTGMPYANLFRAQSHPSKSQGLPPYRVSQSSPQCQLFTAPQFCSHKRLQFESCCAQVQHGNS